MGSHSRDWRCRLRGQPGASAPDNGPFRGHARAFLDIWWLRKYNRCREVSAGGEKPMDANSPLSYLGSSLEQVAFVVKDLDASQSFFTAKMGVPRFYVVEDFGKRAIEKTFRGQPVEHNFRLALAYSGATQIELIQHLSGETTYKEFLERKGEGLHHLGFFLDDRERHERALSEFARGGYPVLMSGRLGDARYTYFDTEAAIGSIMEIVYLGPEAKALMARIKRGEF